MSSRRDLLLSVLATTFTSMKTDLNAESRANVTHSTAPGSDLILHNGSILTLDDHSTQGEAIAIRGERVLSVGTNAAILRNQTRGTKIIDLKGHSVVPGLIDVHAHMDREGLKTLYPSLGTVRSISDIQDCIADLARKTEPGAWIVTMPFGTPPFYFDNSADALLEKRWPNRHDLDKAAPRNPVYIRSIWGFWRTSPPLVSCANSEALQRARIDRETKSPDPSVTIEQDSNGEPTGVFIESELQPLAELIWFRDATRFSGDDRRRTLPAAAAAYHAYGTTSIFEGHGVANELLRAYEDVHREGRLSMRSSLAFSPDWNSANPADLQRFLNSWIAWVGGRGLGNDQLRVNGLYVQTVHRKSNEIRASVVPYTGWAGHNYANAIDPGRLKEFAVACAWSDIRLVINSGMSPKVLDILDEVDREVPLKGRRWVLGHVGGVDSQGIDRIARLDLTIGLHLNAAIYKAGDDDLRRLPIDRHREIAPVRDLLSAGIKVAFESDNVPVSLFWPVWLAVARRSRTNQQIAPEQSVSRIDALRCATLGGAFVTLDDDKLGTLKSGKLADLAILDKNPLSVNEDGIRDIRSLATMVGGKFVYQDDGVAMRE